MIARPRTDMSPLLAVNRLGVAFATDQGMVRAVDDVSFQLHPGRSLFLVGESGSGKSVLCKSILGLLPGNGALSADSSVSFHGEELTRFSARQWNQIRGRRIGMIFQDPRDSLNPVMKIGEQVAESLIYHLKMDPGDAGRRAEQLLASVGIPNPDQRLAQYPYQLSGGLCQRVAIAIAIACDPELLIADEPTTALDVTVQAEILDLLRRLQRDNGMALILVTHDLGVATGRADEIAVMYTGKIVEYAPAQELFTHMCMPYTVALTDSIPRIENPPHTPLPSIKGHPPSLLEIPAGCNFAPRCSLATPECREKEPRLKPATSDDHLFACWHPVHGSGS